MDMKSSCKFCLSALLLLFSVMAGAQTPDFPTLDKSPLDLAYYPPRAAFRFFAKSDEARKADEPLIRVMYSRPQKKGREIFGGLEPYGKVWRAGANENTEIRFYADAQIGDTRVPAGTYSLFVIPEESQWTLILNKDLDAWGAYSYQEAADVLRHTVAVERAPREIEEFSIQFEQTPEGASMIIGWDRTIARFLIVFP